MSELTLEKLILKEAAAGKMVSPSRRRGCVEHVVAKLGVSERTACRVLGQHRSTRRKVARTADDEAALTADIVELARRYGRYGYRRITALLREAGWQVNRKRVERIWRREGLKVPARQPKRAGCGWPTARASGCGRSGRTMSGPTTSSRTEPGTAASSGCSCMVDEFTREALAIRVARRLNSSDVIDVLADLFLGAACPRTSAPTRGRSSSPRRSRTGLPASVRRPPTSSRQPLGKRLCRELQRQAQGRAAERRDLPPLREAQVLIENWRRHYNAIRPHSRSDTVRPPRRSSSLLPPRGRLRNPDQLRRPRSRWSHDPALN